MAHVTVTIAGRTFRMACSDGEESHLETLAAGIDARIATLRESFGEIGDQRLTVMAAITFADELSEAKRSLQKREDELAAAQQREAQGEETRVGWAMAFLDTLERTAERIERVAADLDAAETA